MLKQPYITKFCEEDIQSMVKTIYDLGYPKDILIDYPNLFYMLPVTLKNRYKILEECGFNEVTPQLLLSYLNVMKQKTVGELRNHGLIPQFFNMENRLASCMTQWPTSLTTLIYGDVNLLTLHSLRLKIIQRYLELVIDLTEDEFLRGLKTYPTLQHRPLKAINETLVILQSKVAMPKYKIKSNLYLIHADPDNLTQILFKLRELGGIDIKDVIRMYPKLAAKNYSTLQEIKDILKKHGIGPEAQSRCFQVFTLSPKTVDERIIHAKTTPEFSIYINHPRFLKMILYNKTVLKRIINLKNQNKNCLSLNVLSGCSVRYESFEKAPGDRLGKGKDLVFAISQVLGSGFSTKNIRNRLRKHPFWINIPLIEVKDSYNRYKRKQKQSIGSARAKNSKWQFYERLRYLENTPSERQGRTSVEKEQQSSASVEKEVTNTSPGVEYEDTPHEAAYTSVHNTPSKELPGTSKSTQVRSNIPLSNSSEKSTVKNTKRKRQKEDEFIKFMKDREENRHRQLESLKSQESVDDISTFTKHIEMMLRKLSARSRVMAKTEIFNIVSKYEIRDIEDQTERPYTSSPSNSHIPTIAAL
ncbi:unnamed protein product [Pieris brassicae]|uniref:Uncharacterized protein n=1 Tax=Pieris brassicae TaxID=7116 RepID=A0A9P0TFM6_PIEBR|nr:unnamed protein product [Pieris brassicae]